MKLLMELIAFLLFLFSASAQVENCYQYSCDTLGEITCVTTNDQERSVQLGSIYCNNDDLKFCDINDRLNGQCKAINKYYEPVTLYPGDPCTEKGYTDYCAYGP